MEETEIENLLEQYFEKCEFSDECDECGNEKQEQSWAKVVGFPSEVDYYLCQSCALKRIGAINNLKSIDT